MNLPSEFKAVVVAVDGTAVTVETKDTPTRGATIETLQVMKTNAEAFENAVGEVVAVERYEYRKEPRFRVV